MTCGRRESSRSQAGYLRDHPDVGVVLGRQNSSSSQASPSRAGSSGRVAPRKPTGIPAALLVTRREVWDLVGPFALGLGFSEDTDWLMHAHDLGVRIDLLEEVVLHRRIHGANITYDDEAMLSGLASVLKRRIDRRRAAELTPVPAPR